MASSPKRGRSFDSVDGVESYRTDGNIVCADSNASTERQARGENDKTEARRFDHAVTSPNITPSSPVSPPPLHRRMAGPLTKQEMEKNRQFGGDDYILANPSRKTNEEARREMEEMICEFETMAEERQTELRMKPIVFANTDFVIALVGKRGCRLGFSDGSAYLDIPAEALEEYKAIYMYKLPEHTNVTGPADQRKIYSYSGLMTCGPEGTHFNKDVTLNFEHCAVVDDSKRSLRLAVLGRKNETTPWIKQEQTKFSVKGNRVEHHLGEFSQRCYGLEGEDTVDAPRLRMCLMLAVPRARRHCVEVVLMRDEISLINAHRDNFINTWGFEPCEVHVIRGVAIDPTLHVSFEGTSGFSENGPNDWNLRGFYSTMMRAARTGHVGLSLQQPDRETPIAAITITEQGEVEIDNTGANLQVDGLSYPYVHTPTQVEDSGRLLTESPHFAQSFAGRHNLQTFDGNAPSTWPARERERIPHLQVQRADSSDSGCSYPPGDESATPAAEGVKGPTQAQLEIPLGNRDHMFDSGCTSSFSDDEEQALPNTPDLEPWAEESSPVSDFEDNPSQSSDAGQGEESRPNAERYPVPYEQDSAEGEAPNPPEAADENLPPTEERIAEVAGGAAPTRNTSSAEECSQSSDLPNDPQLPKCDQGLPNANGHEDSQPVAVLEHPGPHIGQVDTQMPNGSKEPPQSPDLETASATEETLAVLPGNDRVARRRHISTSSLRSDDSEVLDAQEGENMEHPVAACGGDNESPTSGMRSRLGSSSSRKEDVNDLGQ